MFWLPTAIQGASGIASYFLKKEYADKLEGHKIGMPEGVAEAESVHSALAKEGLPGAEGMKSEADQVSANTLSQAKEMADSPSALMGTLAKSQAINQDAVRKINTQDAMAKIQNRQGLAQFLGRVKAPTQLNVDKYNSEIDIAADNQRLGAWGDLFQGTSNAAASYITGKGGQAQMDYLNEKTNYLKKFWDTGGDNTAYTTEKQKQMANFILDNF